MASGMKFRAARFKMKLMSLKEGILPSFLGQTIRGGFGVMFKKVTCLSSTGCREACAYPETCIYSYVFNTPPPKTTEMMRKYQAAPHPFVLEPPWGKLILKEGDTFTFGLVLVGKAMIYFPYFLLAFQKLGQAGLGKQNMSFGIVEATIRDGKGDEVNVYDGSTGTLQTANIPDVSLHDGFTEKNVSRITLHFQTPTRLKFNEKLVTVPHFHVLLRNLLRRLSLLSYFHCGEEPDIDFRGLIEKAQKVALVRKNTRWVDLERYSTRQKTSMKLGGFVGEASYEGNLSEFMPYLRLGELVHIGKATSFGLGK